ncbi:MAG TPA: hypothetical protein VF936_06840 [Burkholderiales bacterium]|jgi:starvation-inducible outer membrane lipoprotein
MNRIIATALLLTFAVSGCASLPDSIKGPFAHSGSTRTDASQDQAEVSPYPKQSPFGN